MHEKWDHDFGLNASHLNLYAFFDDFEQNVRKGSSEKKSWEMLSPSSFVQMSFDEQGFEKKNQQKPYLMATKPNFSAMKYEFWLKYSLAYS